MLKLQDIDLKNPIDISIPVSFGKKQLVTFDGPPAKKSAYKAGSFVGDMRHGGSCNCEVYTFSPHLNGTHTECVGHITKERIFVQNVGLAMATLVTVTPEKRLITAAMLKKLKPIEALVGAYTLPNGTNKTTRNYSKIRAAIFYR